MDDVTGIGDEKVLRQYNQWREVCRWDVGPSRYPEDHAMTDHVEALRRNVWAYREAFDAALAAFEELAGEHNRYLAHRGSLDPSPGPGWYWVRGHWRSRAQNSAAIDPDQGTVQAAPGEGQTGASGEATGHSPEGADPQIRDAYCRGRSGIPLGNWCNESQSGDATGADKEQPCPGCGSYRGTHGLGCRILALTQSGEERSE